MIEEHRIIKGKTRLFECVQMRAILTLKRALDFTFKGISGDIPVSPER